jgi:glucose-1-phosphate thymidylyltransferase
VKGIVLAGGRGTRLHPITRAVNKQLLPVYDKPMVYYPLSVLMLAGIREILIVTTADDMPLYRRLFGSGEGLGLSLRYAAQTSPEGIAQALLIGRDFLAGEGVTLVLGDNIFYGNMLPALLRKAIAEPRGATIFACEVREPGRYGVVSFDERWRPLSIEEKPAAPRSTWAVTGLYVYDSRAPAIAAELAPSARGELEITDVNRAYLKASDLRVERLGRGFAWLDTGTCDSLLEAAEFVRSIQHRQALPIACLEEIAFRQGWIDAAALSALAAELGGSSYGEYLRAVAAEGRR